MSEEEERDERARRRSVVRRTGRSARGRDASGEGNAGGDREGSVPPSCHAPPSPGRVLEPSLAARSLGCGARRRSKRRPGGVERDLIRRVHQSFKSRTARSVVLRIVPVPGTGNSSIDESNCQAMRAAVADSSLLIAIFVCGQMVGRADDPPDKSGGNRFPCSARRRATSQKRARARCPARRRTRRDASKSRGARGAADPSRGRWPLAGACVESRRAPPSWPARAERNPTLRRILVDSREATHPASRWRSSWASGSNITTTMESRATSSVASSSSASVASFAASSGPPARSAICKS